MAYKFALIGFPLTHSISAVIHKAGFQTLGIEGSYEVLETPPDELISRLKFLKANDFNGFNVTIPLKVPVSLFLDQVDQYADVAGCVNTVKILPDKSLSGFNTDVYGFKNAIPEDVKPKLKDSNVSIIGTGGAARACAVGLIELGVKQISFFSRNIINSSTMVNYMRKAFPQTKFKLYQMQSFMELLESKMIVNATPTGMKGHSADKMPLGMQIIHELPTDIIVFDVIYNPVKTLFLEKVSQRGIQTINGLDMLIHQAAKSLELWTGFMPDIDKMKIAALEELLV